MKRKTTLLTLLLCLAQFAFAQYCLDGNYCPPGAGSNACFPGSAGEYSIADSIVVNVAPSSTCTIGTIYFAKEDSDPTNTDVFMSFSHGNGGNAFFRAYFNTDCDQSTGALTALETANGTATQPVYGAEFEVGINANGVIDYVNEWDGTMFNAVTNGANAVTGGEDCAGGGANFLEFAIPATDFLGDPCDPSPVSNCGAVELTTVLANAGGSPNSSFCASPLIQLSILVNRPPVANFVLPDTLCQSVNEPNDWPNVFIDASGSSDADLGAEGDTLDYTWASNLEAPSAFSNQFGKATVDGSEISTFYQVTQSGIHEISLTVTDRFGCDSILTGATDPDFSFVVLDFTNPRCAFFPISLVSFTGTAIEKDQVLLNWTTESELNSDVFNILRRDGNQGEFIQVGQMSAAGTSNTIRDYEFIDEISNVNTEVVYYWLQEVDFDGTETYSDIIAVRPSAFEAFEVLIQTNPVNEVLTVQVNGSDETTNMLLQNMNGTVVMNQSIDQNQSGSSVQFDISQLTSGTYLASFTNSKHVVQKKILVIK